MPRINRDDRTPAHVRAVREVHGIARYDELAKLAERGELKSLPRSTGGPTDISSEEELVALFKSAGRAEAIAEAEREPAARAESIDELLDLIDHV